MTDRSNVLLVAFDSLSAHDLHQHLDELPTLHALMGKGQNFTNAYTSCPESSPNRASLFTGLDIAVHGLWTDGVALPKRETTLPEVLAVLGYHRWLVARRRLAGVSNWTTEYARQFEYHHFDWAHGPLHRSRQNAYLAWLQSEASDQYVAIFPRQADPDDTSIPSEQRQTMMTLPDSLRLVVLALCSVGLFMPFDAEVAAGLTDLTLNLLAGSVLIGFIAVQWIATNRIVKEEADL